MKHIHVHLHDSSNLTKKQSSEGVTTWGGADPKKVVPKAIHDAGTSEGAKKAAQTRKAHARLKRRAALAKARGEVP